MSNRRIATAIAAAFLTAATVTTFPVAAHAQDASLSVRTGDLSTHQGRLRVLASIQRRVHSACDEHGGLSVQIENKKCEREIGGQMIAQLKSPEMVALWSGKGDGVEVAARGN